MSAGGDMLLDGWRSHWELLGKPMVIFRGRKIPCTHSRLQRGMELGLGPPVEQLRRILTIPKFATQTTDEAKTLTADTQELSADQIGDWSADTTLPADVEGEVQTADSEEPSADADIMPPKPGAQMVFENRDHEVESVEEDSAGAFWIVHLVSPNS